MAAVVPVPPCSWAIFATSAAAGPGTPLDACVTTDNSPKCQHEHRLKQDPRWTVEQHPDGTLTWTTPSGRQYTTGPTEYPI